MCDNKVVIHHHLFLSHGLRRRRASSVNLSACDLFGASRNFSHDEFETQIAHRTAN
jgi:hypothetical protein